MQIPNTSINLNDNLSGPAAELAAKNQTEFDQVFMDMLRTVGRVAVENEQTVHGSLWERPDAPDTLKNLTGRVVVDLGCGDSAESREFLRDIKPKTYLGVDHLISFGYRPFEKTELGVVTPLSVEEGDAVDGALIKADMLDIVSRLPDASCSFVINGVDDFILDPTTAYSKELIDQIDRATEQDGYIIGVNFGRGILEAFRRMPGYESEVVQARPTAPRYISHHKTA